MAGGRDARGGRADGGVVLLRELRGTGSGRPSVGAGPGGGRGGGVGGADEQTAALFSYVSCEARVPADHPLRLIRAVVDEALEALSGEFEGLYARVGRPSIAPGERRRGPPPHAGDSVR